MFERVILQCFEKQRETLNAGYAAPFLSRLFLGIHEMIELRHDKTAGDFVDILLTRYA
jgi:hypothetical protein